MDKRLVVADCAALLAGCLIPLSLAPFEYWVLAIVSVSVFFLSVSRGSVYRTAFRFYLYNLGMFLVGVSWIYVSINEYGGASPLLAGFLVILFVFAYALIAVPQGAIYAKFIRSVPLYNIVGFSALWVLQEWFRSWFMTGFPWLFLGYGLDGTYLVNYAPMLGVLGVSLAACLSSTCLVVLIIERRYLLLAPILLVFAGGWLLRGIELTEPEKSISVSVIQGNVDQHTKWRRESIQPILERYSGMSRPEWGRELIVWPEAAVTLFRENAGEFISAAGQVARKNESTLVLGIPDRNSSGGFQNTVIAIGEGGGQYIKRRLVPFGEYVPLENLLRGLIRFFDLPMSHNEPGPSSQAPLTAGDLTLSASICYEVVYPELVRTSTAGADLLLTVSNDTWFGSSIGPWQHLQMARMRALENGRAMVRATNNGVTALIDHRGNLVASLPQFEQGVLRGKVEIRSGATPFQRFGQVPILLICLISVLLPGARGWTSGREA